MEMESCRACLQVSHPDELRSLLADDDIESLAAAQTYTLLTSIDIKPGADNSPHHICPSCTLTLADIRRFRELCLESDKQLRAAQLRVDVIKPEPPGYDYDENSIDNIDTSDLFTIKENDASDSDNASPQKPPSPSLSPAISNTAPVGKSRRTFRCDLCPKVFNKRHRIEAHLRVHVGLLPWVCELCTGDRAFRKFCSLRDHQMRKHATEEQRLQRRRHHCEVEGCTKSYWERSSMLVHVKRVHRAIGDDGKLVPDPTKRLVCDQCGASYHSNQALADHMLSQHGDRSQYPHVCDLCQRRFVNKYAMQAHAARHAGVRNFACSQCPVRTFTNGELAQHMAFHNKVPTEQCDRCPKRYTTKLGLQRHFVRAHEQRKPHVCTYCGLSFGALHTLRNHMLRHTGEKPHACPICERRFTQLVTMRTHIKRVHEGQKSKWANKSKDSSAGEGMPLGSS